MTDPVFYHVAELARLLNRHIAVFDLETTTFRGRPEFAIMEVACFVVTPGGPALELANLINPEFPISQEASRLTGITQSMVGDKEVWGERYAPLFQTLATDSWVAGFNNSTFDQPAVIEMNARYGQPIEAFAYSFDVRQLFLRLTEAKSKKGTLAEVAQALGVALRPDAHRALADVVLTLEALHALIARFGLQAVHEAVIAPPQKKVAAKERGGEKSKLVRVGDSVDVSALPERYRRSPAEVSFDVSRAIDERQVDPALFAQPDVLEWLEPALVELPLEVLTSGKLKPMYEALGPIAAGHQLDYVQLRIALLRSSLGWSTLRPEI